MVMTHIYMQSNNVKCQLHGSKDIYRNELTNGRDGSHYTLYTMPANAVCNYPDSNEV